MVLNRLFYPLWLDTDITLRGRGGAVLQQPLYQRYVIAVIFVNLRGIVFTETVGADAGDA